MKYRQLGKSGLLVSWLGLGTMIFGEDSPRSTPEAEALQMIDRYLDQGDNHIDTANVYARGKSEEIIGNALQRRKRDQVILATKVRGITGPVVRGWGLTGSEWTPAYAVKGPTEPSNKEFMMKPTQIAMAVLTAGLLVTTMTGARGADWPQYRGKAVPELAKSLPKGKWEPVWKASMSGDCHAGIAVAEGVVVVPDCGDGHDYYRAYDVATGKQLWEKKYSNEREMDYGPGPRATPLIYKGKTYVVSAFGEVYCFDLKTGNEVWKNTYADMGGGEPDGWGFCTSPIEVNGKVILFPGDLVAVDPDTGKEAWRVVPLDAVSRHARGVSRVGSAHAATARDVLLRAGTKGERRKATARGADSI